MTCFYSCSKLFSHLLSDWPQSRHKLAIDLAKVLVSVMRVVENSKGMFIVESRPWAQSILTILLMYGFLWRGLTTDAWFLLLLAYVCAFLLWRVAQFTRLIFDQNKGNIHVSIRRLIGSVDLEFPLDDLRHAEVESLSHSLAPLTRLVLVFHYTWGTDKVRLTLHSLDGAGTRLTADALNQWLGFPPHWPGGQAGVWRT